MTFYTLDGHVPVPCELVEWLRCFKSLERRVAINQRGPIRVSTVFLGIDHAWDNGPLLFETMIFGGEHDGYQDRCSTWKQAEAMHKKAYAFAFGEQE